MGKLVLVSGDVIWSDKLQQCYQSRHSALLSTDDRQLAREPGIGRLPQAR
jgi:hypothetical protein